MIKLTRDTKETQITLSLNVHGNQQGNINTIATSSTK